MKISDFIGIVRELSFSEIRHEAMVPPRFLIVAREPADGDEWRKSIFGDDAHPFVEVMDTSDTNVDPHAYDAIISIGELEVALARDWADRFRRANEEMRLIEVDVSLQSEPPDATRIQRVICDVCRDRSVAFGRYIESMRGAATTEIVADTARVNAQFAALSNIPAMVPVVGTLFAAGADLLVLTKNQLMMMYRLAAIYDRDLDDRWKIYSELLPVVGAGFLWRTTARQAAAVLPVALGAVPKVAIAYAGTYAIGQAARAYYDCGYEISADEMQRLYERGVAVLTRAERHEVAPQHASLPQGQASVGDSGSN